MMRRFPLSDLLVAALALLAPLNAAAAEEPRAKVGLFTTLPIYWPEVRGISELIGLIEASHWARGEIERDYDLVPLDALAGEGAILNGLDRLLLAQPRTLSPAENVALDAWVRQGGHLLLFADPLLTGGSRFALGDKRRPQDVALLSPILSHWGLQLRFDEDQPVGERLAELGDLRLPINAAGRFSYRPADEPDTSCIPRSGGLMAECTIGEGRALIVADAALFDGDAPTPERERALDWLIARAFAP
jgi:hypothetical protein